MNKDLIVHKMGHNQGQTLIGSALMIRSNTKTISLTGREYRENIVDAAEGI